MAEPRFDTHTGEFWVSPGPNLNESPQIQGVTNVEYTTDIDRWPYIICTITAARPDPATLAGWDPRTFPIVWVSLLQEFSATSQIPAQLADVSDAYAGGTLADVDTAATPGTLAGLSDDFPATPLLSAWNTASNADPYPEFTQKFAQLYLTDVDSDYDDNTVTLTLQSGEFRLDDNKRVATTKLAYTATSLYNLANDVVMRVGGTLTGWTGASVLIPAGDESTWNPGESAADFITPLLEARGLRIYAESATEYSLAPIGEHTGYGVTSTIGLHHDAGMVTAARQLSASGGDDSTAWFDAAVVVYEWTNAAGDSLTAYDVFPTNGAHTRATVQRRSRPWPGAGAAKGLVQRSKKRGYTIRVTQRSNYAVTCGWTAGLTLPDDTAPTNYKITAVAWSYPKAEMTLNLQAPIVTL